jgi:hypothetical protein
MIAEQLGLTELSVAAAQCGLKITLIGKGTSPTCTDEAMWWIRCNRCDFSHTCCDTCKRIYDGDDTMHCGRCHRRSRLGRIRFVKI